jgi:hypothetical protein
LSCETDITSLTDEEKKQIKESKEKKANSETMPPDFLQSNPETDPNLAGINF